VRAKCTFLYFVMMVVFMVSFTVPLPAAPTDIDFYKGKVINYVVATKPGGGYDAYARLIGKHMQKYIPGATIIVKNIPGAGHIIGANETYLAKPDGLTIGTFNSGLIYSQIVGFQGIKFDLTKYSWIGKASNEVRVFVVGVNTPYKTFKDILESREPVKMAASGVGTSAYNDVLITATATGAPLKVIPGYGGREGEMAMMRGEVVGQIGSYIGLTAFLKAKECRVILQIAARKHRDLNDIPLASELKITDKAKKILAVIEGTAELGRLTAAPPNVPAGRVRILRDAYKKALTDPELLKEAAKMDLDIDPGYGEDAAKLVKAAINQPLENMEILKKIIKIE
jgi:tripartite-type tricarboxylate transporter receptor subunit TctC